MTSLFDQFEQASARTKNNNLSSADLTNLGYINVSLDQEPPIFRKFPINAFRPSQKITHVAISSRYIVAAMESHVLLRMNLDNPLETSEISLTKYTQNKLINLFLDPTGHHLLLQFSPVNKTMESPELMYLNRKSDKIKSSTKFRGNKFTAVGWNLLNESENTTGPILLGTSKGLIIETEILEGDKFFSSSLEQYWRQVFDIGKNTDTPITGLEYFKIERLDKYMIFATTPTKFYYFCGRVENSEKPIFPQIFDKYLNIPENDTFMACDSKLGYSRLQFWSEDLMTPNKFVWITGKGIHYGQINPETDSHILSIKGKTKLLEHPKPPYEDPSVSPKYPIAIALTQFHILLAYTDSIKGMCLLNEEVVYDDEAFRKLISVVKDPRTGDIWAVTEKELIRYKVHREERNIWKIFCNNNQFDLAKKYSRDNQAFYNQVLLKEADMLFEQKRYEESAGRYAETESSFEEICLKFIQVNQSDPLKMFLTDKLRTLKPQDKTQITMIVIWVVELYLNKLEEERLKGLEKSANYDDIQKEFETFMVLPEVADCIKNNKATIYELMQSHGDKSNLMKLTILNKDFEQLIRQHIFKNNFREALEVLKSQNNLELYYQFAPILIQEIPTHMVKTLMETDKREIKRLVPLRLLPALVSCNGKMHSMEVIKYLEHCINKMKNTDRAIHNFLFSLYAKYDPNKIMKYLDNPGKELFLDIHFALRLCTEYNLTEACVRLSGLLQLWESAVDLALKVNLDLAKKMADMPPEDDVELRKKLWLKIAQHIVSEKDDIKEAMDFLRQCELIKIEDILPFFSDFVTIDHFKDAICKSLQKYNDRIKELKKEMEDATKSAEQVRKEILSFRNCYAYINSVDHCEICHVTLMIRPFYLFPCHHKFHSDCLLAELAPYLGPAKKSRLADLERQLKLLNTQANSDNISTGSTGMSAKDQVKAEIDNIIASECLYCGENMIQNIDRPFIEDYEYESILREWE